MSMLATSLNRPVAPIGVSRTVSRPANRTGLRVVARGTGPGAGNSDPQKVHEQKEKKVRSNGLSISITRSAQHHLIGLFRCVRAALRGSVGRAVKQKPLGEADPDQAGTHISKQRYQG